jgi:hypothetical protein
LGWDGAVYHGFILTWKHGQKWGQSNAEPPTPEIYTSLCRGDGCMCIYTREGESRSILRRALLDLTRTMYVATYWSNLDHPPSGGGCPKNKEAGTSRLKPWGKKICLPLVLNPKNGWLLVPCTCTCNILQPSPVFLVRFANIW